MDFLFEKNTFKYRLYLLDYIILEITDVGFSLLLGHRYIQNVLPFLRCYEGVLIPTVWVICTSVKTTLIMEAALSIWNNICCQRQQQQRQWQ